MRLRSLVLLGVVTAGVLSLLRRLGPHVELAYGDGSVIRLDRSVEARDLARDATEILAAAR